MWKIATINTSYVAGGERRGEAAHVPARKRFLFKILKVHPLHPRIGFVIQVYVVGR